MASFSVTGSITVRRLRTGASLSLVLDVTGALAQVVNVDSGEVSPDWTNEGNQPTITPRVSVTPSASVTVSVDEASGQGWWYNSTLLSFSETNLTVDGWMIEEGDGRFAYNSDTHAIRIIKNLASRDNYASDTLQFICTVTYEGNEYEMSASQTIAIMPGGTSGYNGYLQAGTQILDDEVKSTKIYAYLWDGKEVVQSFTTKWYSGQVADGYEFAGHSGDKTETEDGSAYVTVDRDDVNGGNNNDGTASGGTLFICQFYNLEGTLVATRGVNIVDEADEYSVEMGIASDSPASTLDAGTVRVTAAIYSNSQTGIVMDYTQADFEFHVLNGEFESIAQETVSNPTDGIARFDVLPSYSTSGNDVIVRCDVTFTLPTYTT